MIQMAQNNIGSLVVLKPGKQQMIAGILTERGIAIKKKTMFNLESVTYF